MRSELTLFNFTYDVVLIIVFTAVLSIAVCLYMMRKRHIAVPVIGLYSVYLIDTLIIFMTEALPSFNQWYEEGFVYSPSLKTIVFLGCAFFTMSIWNALLDRKFSHVQGMILLAMGLYCLFVPLMQTSAMKSWLYFLCYQMFTFFGAIYGLWKLKRLNNADYEGPFGWIRVVLVLTILFSVFIVVEDTIVIFNFDNYSPGETTIYARNMSEDILRMIYTVFFFRLFVKQFRRNWMTAPESFNVASSAEPVAEPEPEPQSAVAPEVVMDYKKLKFVQWLGLTEREVEVFSELLEGKTNQQISDSLCISMGTVKAHIHNIFQKAGVTHRYELLRQYDAFVPDIPV